MALQNTEMAPRCFGTSLRSSGMDFSASLPGGEFSGMSSTAKSGGEILPAKEVK